MLSRRYGGHPRFHISTSGLEANPARNATSQEPRPFRFETASTFWCHRHRQARAGWTLVEKFDSNRLRLKRSPGAGENDRHLNFDAWRTQIGASRNKYEAKIALVVAVLLFAVVSIAAVVGIAIFGPPG